MPYSHRPVCDADSADPERCRAQPGELHQNLRLLPGQLPVHAPVHKYRHDHRPNACHRHPSTIHELRRLLPLGLHRDARHLHRPRPPGKEILLNKIPCANKLNYVFIARMIFAHLHYRNHRYGNTYYDKKVSAMRFFGREQEFDK